MAKKKEIEDLKKQQLDLHLYIIEQPIKNKTAKDSQDSKIKFTREKL